MALAADHYANASVGAVFEAWGKEIEDGPRIREASRALVALRLRRVFPQWAEVRTSEPQINMPAWVLCMSWCADLECPRNFFGLHQPGCFV